MVRRALFITTLSVAVFAAFASVASAPLTGIIEAHKVSRQGDREVFTPAEKAAPQDIIEYRLTYANSSKNAIRNVAVTDPIPTGTEYIRSTATMPNEGRVEFSIDAGKSYHSWPVRYKKVTEDGREVWAEATAEMVSHIRWTIPGEFEPETEITFSYRAVVK